MTPENMPLDKPDVGTISISILNIKENYHKKISLFNNLNSLIDSYLCIENCF
jgi:hypothetical protein